MNFDYRVTYLEDGKIKSESVSLDSVESVLSEFASRGLHVVTVELPFGQLVWSEDDVH